MTRPAAGAHVLESRSIRLPISVPDGASERFLTELIAPRLEELRRRSVVCQWAYGYGSAPGFERASILWLHARFPRRGFTLLGASRRMRDILRPDLGRYGARIVYGFPDRQDLGEARAFHGGEAGLRFYFLMRRFGSRLALEFKRLEAAGEIAPAKTQWGLALALYYLRVFGVPPEEVLESLDPYLDSLLAMLPDAPEQRQAWRAGLDEQARRDLRERAPVREAVARLSRGDWSGLEGLGLGALAGSFRRCEKPLRRLKSLYFFPGSEHGRPRAEKALGMLHIHLLRLRVLNRHELYVYALLRAHWEGREAGHSKTSA